jgi:hypothetical protein
MSAGNRRLAETTTVSPAPLRLGGGGADETNFVFFVDPCVASAVRVFSSFASAAESSAATSAFPSARHENPDDGAFSFAFGSLGSFGSFVASGGRSFSLAFLAARCGGGDARGDGVRAPRDGFFVVGPIAQRRLRVDRSRVVLGLGRVVQHGAFFVVLASAHRESRVPSRRKDVPVADGARGVDVRVFRVQRVAAEPEEQQHDPGVDVGHVHVRPGRFLEAPDQHLERALLFELRVYAETLAQGVHLIAHSLRIWVGERVVPRVVQAVVVRDGEVLLASLDADDALDHLREQRVDLLRALRGERRRHGADAARVRPTLTEAF